MITYLKRIADDASNYRKCKSVKLFINWSLSLDWNLI